MADVNPKLSILLSVKKLLGIEPTHNHFDTEIILNINSVLMVLNQLGIGSDGFMIEDENDTWDSFLSNRKDLNAVKTYVYLKVRLMFDPPQMGYLVENIKDQIAEFEWRLNIQAESDLVSEETEDSDTSFPPIDNHTLKITNNVLAVNTTNEAQADNTLPITSAGVHVQVGNVGEILKTI